MGSMLMLDFGFCHKLYSDIVLQDLVISGTQINEAVRVATWVVWDGVTGTDIMGPRQLVFSLMIITLHLLLVTIMDLHSSVL